MMEKCHGCRKEIGGYNGEDCLDQGVIIFCSRTCTVNWAMTLPITDPAWNGVKIPSLVAGIVVGTAAKQDEPADPHFRTTGSV